MRKPKNNKWINKNLRKVKKILFKAAVRAAAQNQFILKERKSTDND
jgi:hypothetical protein